MLHVEKIKPLTKEFLESIGFYWHTDNDNTSYVADELVLVSNEEVEAYYEAANELYDMFAQAGQYVIDNNLFHELNIPFNLVELIKNSWENDVHWHLYGRFDFAGGIDGKPIKLMEFNADTPTSLYETAIIQWAMLKANGMDEAKQFNTVFEALKENFKRLVVLGGDTEDFSHYYEGWKILFSSIRGNIEDENTTRLLQSAANEAGFHTDFAYVDEVGFNQEGVFKGDENFEYWFKLIPWENIAIEEGDLALLLDEIVREQKAIILNPAYTLLFQSKAFMKVLWDMFPNHPLLLETSFEPLKGQKQVEKRAFGREGANTVIYERDMSVIEQTEGEYGNFKPIYQAYVELPKDSEGRSYQAGVFFAYEGCGLGFRRGGLIMENFSKFVAHRIKD
ncbi:glutathionylspermidine synthase family protein [Sulfurospirillum barnesii]|uniref:Glutathionylspermidine synthase n=1 Tax=Sulfurospirillum barnesii (strain ATCC 700032 / DSM 10660 / SES-3) TaxID=760154 RepID=I3XU25_SULBS|nr:glutathionylspermidine synthase family protein [Sulfurospirillum barnesii]AFL67449.1 glutathionylspermidine synthase [Sulfurospirillum barnesii SES-3]